MARRRCVDNAGNGSTYQTEPDISGGRDWCLVVLSVKKIDRK